MSHEFLDKVLDMVENPASVEHDDQCTDALVNLLLAYNLHFPFQEANDIMSILAKKGTVKVFTEKLLEIFNKGGKKCDCVNWWIYVFIVLQNAHQNTFDNFELS